MISLTVPLFSSSWLIGYKVGIDGYDSSSLGKNEYWQVGLNFNLVPQLLWSPQIEVGVLLPQLRSESPFFINLGLNSGLAVWHNHPLKNNFRRESALVPRLEVSIAVAFKEPYLNHTSILFEPFNFHFGDKQIGVMGFHLIYNVEQGEYGWGIRLFEINNWIF